MPTLAGLEDDFGEEHFAPTFFVLLVEGMDGVSP